MHRIEESFHLQLSQIKLHKYILLFFIFFFYFCSIVISDELPVSSNLAMNIKLKDLSRVRVGFSEKRIDAENPAPAVSLPSASMTTIISADADGNAMVHGEITLYAFWEIFSLNDVKIKLKITNGKMDQVGEAGNVIEDNVLDWGCRINQEDFPQESWSDGESPYELGMNAGGDHGYDAERSYIVPKTGWAHSDCVELTFFTEDIPMENMGNQYVGEFQVKYEVT